MSGTRRTPLTRRSTQPQITSRAIELFEQLERATRARRRATDCTLTEQGLCTSKCHACRRWFDLHAELHTELRLRPWVWPCLGRCPFPPGTPPAGAWRPGYEQQALWEMLDEARRHAADSAD
jgi:hypothetical protein